MSSFDLLFHRFEIKRQALVMHLARHPKRYALGLTTALMGLTGGAYAVATYGPDAANLPVIQVTEAVATLPLTPQIEQLDGHSLKLYRNDSTRASDTAESLLSRMGLADPPAAAYIRQTRLVRESLLTVTGRNVTVEADDRQQLVSLTVRWLRQPTDLSFQRLTVERHGTEFKTIVQTLPLKANTRLSGGFISSSLFATSDEARIPDSVSKQLTDIFASHIDFHRALKKGDRFSVVYESLEADGEPLRAGRVLSAEFVTAGQTHQAVWFQESGQPRGGYFSLDGSSLRRAYLAAPLTYTRITSGYGMRSHPIFHSQRQHQGVDYAAPTGTPVLAIGDGVVEFAGWKNGYGNVVVLKHRNNHSTVYGHLSRIHVRKNQAVNQSMVIGAVGSTGWSTGPHLHFEFRVNDVYTDPSVMLRHSDTPALSAAAKPAFNRVAQQARQELLAAAQMRSQQVVR